MEGQEDDPVSRAMRLHDEVSLHFDAGCGCHLAFLQAHLRFSAWNNLDMGQAASMPTYPHFPLTSAPLPAQFELARCALRLLPPTTARRLLLSVLREGTQVPQRTHRWLPSLSVPSRAHLRWLSAVELQQQHGAEDGPYMQQVRTPWCAVHPSVVPHSHWGLSGAEWERF